MDSDCDGSELGAAAVVVICAPGRWEGGCSMGLLGIEAAEDIEEELDEDDG